MVSTTWTKAVYKSFFNLAGALRLRSVYHFMVDKFEHIDTAGDVLQSELGLNPEVSSKYGPGGWWDLKMALGRDVSADDVFIDFGSGKGRMVYLASRYYPFRRVIGVEFSQKLNDIAQKNVDRNRRRLRCKDIELVTTDVTDYAIPDDVTVVYMYDPFEGPVFRDLIKRLRASITQHPRQVRIIYRNPVMHDCLIENGFAVVLRLQGLVMYAGT